MRLPEGPESRYLAETVGVPLQRALADVCVMRPRDPIEYLANCLYRYAEGMQRQREEESLQEMLRKEATDELLASQHLASISVEDGIMRAEQDRRKKLYLDREREVEILNSPRSSRSRKSSTSDDLGASSYLGASFNRTAANTNRNELAVPGPVPPSSDSLVTDGANDGEQADQELTGNSETTDAAQITVPEQTPNTAEKVQKQESKDEKDEKTASSALPSLDSVDPPAGLTGRNSGTGSEQEKSQQLPQDNSGNDGSKVATASTTATTAAPPLGAAATNETQPATQETEVNAADSAKPEGASAAATGVGEQATEGDPGLYTIGEQEED